MPRRRKAAEPRPSPQRDPDDFSVAVGMLNSIKVLGPDKIPDELKTRAVRIREFAKVKHIMEGYAISEKTGFVVKVEPAGAAENAAKEQDSPAQDTR